MREKEKDRIYERFVCQFCALAHLLCRILLKERKQEDAEFGDKDKFITSAYKKKLIEDQKWEYEDKLADEIEKRTSVASRGMHGFYANLLTKNIAMGSDVSTSAVSAYTAGSERMKMRLGEEDPSLPPMEEPVSPETSSTKRTMDAGDQLDEKKEKKIKVEETLPSEPTPLPPPLSTPPLPVQPPAPVEPQKSKEEIVLSAKERYLQRKQLQQQQQQNTPASDD